MPRVHSVLPERLTDAVDGVLRAGQIEHVAHGYDDPVRAAMGATDDDDAIALIGPYTSNHVAETLEATAPAGLPLLAPAATWAGITRDDEPGCDDPAHPHATVFRMVARDTTVAQRIAAEAREAGARALVIAGDHDYGRQLAGQLRLARLPRAASPAEATLLVLCGLAGEPEIERAAALSHLPLVAFDGVQGADLGDRDAFVAMPYGPVDDLPPEDVLAGVGAAARAAELVAALVREGARDRAALLAALRAHESFDEHGDPVDPEVSLWRAGPDWALEPHRPLTG
jgi:hypothetical protein